MFCCENCFKDVEIKAIVKSFQKGKCSFCENDDKSGVCDVKANENLRVAFEALLDVYSPVSVDEENYPYGKFDLLKNILHSQWHIFDLDADKIYDFMITLFSEKYEEQPDLFDSPIGISVAMDSESLNNYSLLKSSKWEGFVKEIKEVNRFHTDVMNKEILFKLLLATCKAYKKGSIFYRARRCNNPRGHDKDDMGAPPARKASAGRVNPEGISCLYLADSIDTTFKEIRAALHDYVTVATFELLEDIEVVNLATLDKISPFQEIDKNMLAVNIPHLQEIGREIAKPLRRHDSHLDYLPTQYISDYIKNTGYKGIEYGSTMHENGVNLAFFDEKLFRCIDTKTYDVEKLDYKYNEL